MSNYQYWVAALLHTYFVMLQIITLRVIPGDALHVDSSAYKRK